MLIECIPNVSEGRRLDVVSQLADAVAHTPGVTLLDRTSDASHHRSVLTFAGDGPHDSAAQDATSTRGGVKAAVLALFETAIRLIDLRTHHGVHPRLGAVDVVPFVPLDGASMADCVALAKEVAAEVAARFELPVYLYEEAAARPDRRRLEHIRRGQFEGLAAKMQDPAGHPDYGPARPHPTAGASVIGARMPLIAYNVNLASNRLDVARAIAAAIRESSGGLPCVKAMGVPLADRRIVQVSMNLTNFHVTSMRQVFDAIATEAARRGVDVLESEIIGLVPAAALVGTTPEHLRIAGFHRGLILEDRLKQPGKA